MAILACLFAKAALVYGQPPVNDFCVDAIDLSDWLWSPGTNRNSTLHCGADHRIGNCGAAQQGTNKCCSSEGVEGTIWYKFVCPTSGSASLEFRNTACSPTSFFSITTTLQGFIIKKPSCAYPESDSILACFNPNTANDFAQPFQVIAGQEYYVQIDTKKNSFGSCTCASSASCHSYCEFEVRLVPPISLPISGFNVRPSQNFVSIKWLYDWKDNFTAFKLTRHSQNTKDSTVVVWKPIQSFDQEGFFFTYKDFSVEENGIYTYTLYAVTDQGETSLAGVETVVINFAKAIEALLIPNPTSGNVKLVLLNTAGMGYSFCIYNQLGQEILKGATLAEVKAEMELSLSTFQKGMYMIRIYLEDRYIQERLIVY